MPTRNAVFPSNYFKSDALPGGKPVRLTIQSVDWETVGDEQKLVMHFVGPWKPLPLNATNFDACVAAFGKPDSDNWPGEVIEVRSEMVRDPKGKLVPGVRLYGVPQPGLTVKVVPNAKARQEASENPPTAAYEDEVDKDPDDEIPPL